MNTGGDYLKWMIAVYAFILLLQFSIAEINTEYSPWVTIGDTLFGRYITEVNGTITTNPSTVNSDGIIVEGEAISAGDSGIGWFDDYTVMKNYIFGTLGFVTDIVIAPYNIVMMLSTLGVLPPKVALILGIALFMIFMTAIISFITKR